VATGLPIAQALELHLVDSLSAAATNVALGSFQWSKKLWCLPWATTPDGVLEQVAQVVAPNSVRLSRSWQLG
jgi:hypothetical protein